MAATMNDVLVPHYAAYFTPDEKQAAYIARARERAITEGLTVTKGHTKDGRRVALVSSSSEPNKLHVVGAKRNARGRYYVCDCKGMDPYGDKTYQGYVTCKHAEAVRAKYGA